MLPYAGQFLARPRWLAAFFGDGGLMKFPERRCCRTGPMAYADVGAALEQSTVTWEDLEWIRELWKGPIVVKGVHIGDDARRAVDAGADAIVVSNHGGRQLDGVHGDDPRRCRKSSPRSAGGPKCCSTAASAAAATSPRRCASARGRCWSAARTPTAWRPRADPASTRAIEILQADLIRTMKLLGCASVAELDRSYVSCDRW